MAGGITGRFTKPEKVATLMDILREKGNVDNFETAMQTKTGKTINLLLSATMESNVISGVIIDITRVKNLEEQLHQSQKMEALGTLTGGIAHEFNNILMIISTWGTLLQLEINSDNPLRQHIDIIVDAARKAAKLTQGLLSYTRMPIPHKELTDVNELIENIAGYLSNIIRKDIEFKAVTTENNLTILADKAQIEQVIMNLATNALDAMEEMGSLIIRSELIEIDHNFVASQASIPIGTYALISVMDTGSGIDKNIQARVFEPFFTTKGVGKGTGLGLSIVYGIIKKHEGYIHVESKPESGTKFKIYLPLIKPEGAQEDSLGYSLSTGGTGTVLLAEDDEAVMKAISKVLEKTGYNVIVAVNGEDAIRKYKKFKDKINLLLFDIVMPKMNGKDAYEEIKKIDPDIKVLFISGYITDDRIERTIADAGLPFVTKPVSPNKLERKIKNILC
jgi:signal transduction histidine kinase